METSPSDPTAAASATDESTPLERAPDESAEDSGASDVTKKEADPSELPERRSRLPLLLFLLTVLSFATFYVYRYTGKADPEKALVDARAALKEKDWKRFQTAMTVLMHDPQSQLYYHLLAGKALAAQGQREQALAELGNCREEGGAIEIEAMCEVANMMMKEGEQAGAVQLLREAIKIDDQVLVPHQMLVQIYNDWGARGLEQEEAEKWAELAPDDYTPHAWLAQQAYDLDDYTRAVEYYNAALERSSPPEIETHLKSRLAACLVKLSKPNEAEKILDEIQDSKGDGVERVLTLAEVRLLQGEDAMALEIVDRLSQELDKETHSAAFIEALNLKLRILQAQSRPERALEVAKQLIALDKENHAAYIQLGQIYRRLGKTEEAEAAGAEGERLRNLRLRFAELHEVAASQVLDPAPRYELARTALALNRIDLAEMWMAAAKQLDPRGLKRPADLEIPVAETPDSQADSPTLGKNPAGMSLDLDFELPKSKK